MKDPCKPCNFIEQRGGNLCHYCSDWLTKEYFKGLIQTPKKTEIEKKELKTWGYLL